MTKLRIRKAQNEIQLATADFLEFEDLELELPTLDKAVAEYKAAVEDHTRLQDRLEELED